MEYEKTVDAELFHVFLDSRFLADNHCESINSINMIIVPSKLRINYGERGDVFDTKLIENNDGGKFIIHVIVQEIMQIIFIGIGH